MEFGDMQLGYALSSEEHAPSDLVRYARQAEEAGFAFAMISDHFHPWLERQGNSPFVWSVLGAIAHSTTELRVGTGVTCPTIRMHPAIVAHAAATTAAMMPGRFFLGLGTGENLNEHVVGEGWPAIDIRLEMLAEAIVIIRALWTGDEVTHRGAYFDVQSARLYTLPGELPPIFVASGATRSAELAGRLGDGLIVTAPSEETVQAFERGGGRGKPRYGQISVCVDADERQARKTAHEWWPTTALGGDLGQELARPADFEAAARNVREEDVASQVVCGDDPARHIEELEKFAAAGIGHVYVHQIGPDQDALFRFYEQEVMPRTNKVRRAS